MAAPLFHLALKLEGEPCLVVGGGPVGARKAASLLECGAVVTVVSPRICEQLGALPVELQLRDYEAGEVAGYRLAITATGRPEVDRQVYLDGRRAGVSVNAADDPVSCSFLMPAVLRRGDLSVAVSTGGRSPWLAAWVRGQIGALVGEDMGALAGIVGRARSAVRQAGISSEGLDWSRFVDLELWPLVRGGDLAAAEAAAARWVAAAVGGASEGLPQPG